MIPLLEFQKKMRYPYFLMTERRQGGALERSLQFTPPQKGGRHEAKIFNTRFVITF